jgi:5-methyltetrahydropteroyltriglutamate--homocysteine methyltransferase
MFRTTHTGSLPRPSDLTPLLQGREGGDPAPDLDERVSQAVREAVQQQVDAGVDVVNDGEMGKIGYSTYVTSRLSGFERAEAPRPRPLFDVQEFPDLQEYRRPMSPAIRYAYSAVCSGDIKFGTFAGVSNVAPSVVWAKFRSMAEGARRAAERATSTAAAR